MAARGGESLWLLYCRVLQGFSVADFLKAIEDLVQREKEQEGKQ